MELGAFIAKAPGDRGQVRETAIVRSGEAVLKLMVEMKKRKMLEAYDREAHADPTWTWSEGVHVDWPIEPGHRALQLRPEPMTKWIYNKQFQSPEVQSFEGKSDQALVAAGKVSLACWAPHPRRVQDRQDLAASPTHAGQRCSTTEPSLLTRVGTFQPH